MDKVFRIAAFWDGEAKLWVAEGVDVPGGGGLSGGLGR
jgi:hypothetical protein